MAPSHPYRLLLALILASAAHGQARADLAQASPFLPRDQPGTAQAGGTAGPVELRGIMSTDGGFAFCIYDTAKKTGTWVGLNETGYDFVVKSADPARDIATVTYQGRDLRLELRTSKVASAGAAVASSPEAPPAAGINAPPGDEQRRLEAVANEVRRRRMEREKAAQSNGGGGFPAPIPAAPNC
jgi:hypothetical protein